MLASFPHGLGTRLHTVHACTTLLEAVHYSVRGLVFHSPIFDFLARNPRVAGLGPSERQVEFISEMH